MSHYDLNDNVVEGLNCLDIPAFSVQYHPESAAGPHDANYLFDRFAELVREHERSRAGGGEAANRDQGPDSENDESGEA